MNHTEKSSNPKHETGVIAIVVSSEDMGNPLVKGLPATLTGMLSAMGIKAQVVIPEAVHTDADAVVAMSRNIDHLADGPEAETNEGCHDFLSVIESECSAASLLVGLCLTDAHAIGAGATMQERHNNAEHFFFSKAGWLSECREGETELGYWEWVESETEAVLQEAKATGLIAKAG